METSVSDELVGDNNLKIHNLMPPHVVTSSVEDTDDVADNNKKEGGKKKSKLKNPFLLKPTTNSKSPYKNSSVSHTKLLSESSSAFFKSPSRTAARLPSTENKLVISPGVEKFNSHVKYYPFLFPDFEFVYRVLKNNPSLKERTNEIVIAGFESYLVEAWILERELTSMLTAYSGNPNSVFKCCQIFLPMQPSLWSYPELKQYYKIMTKLGSLKYVNDKGFIFVADIHSLNLNHYQIPNLLLIPNGVSLKDVWNNFTLNLNLRELQCAGRTSAMFQAPTMAFVEKFYQLYKIPKKSLGAQMFEYFCSNSYDNTIPATNLLQSGKSTKRTPFLAVYTDVELLIYMIQTSLVFFNLLDKSSVDGLLCKKTQRALIKWQKTVGAVYFPHLNQTLKTSVNFNRINTNLITALLSMVLACFFKLRLLDCIAFSNTAYKEKDPFLDTSLMFDGIIEFQKKLESKNVKLNYDHSDKALNNEGYIKFLDFIIIEKLFEMTDDGEQTEFNQLKRFIKSTAKDFNVAKTGLGKLLSNVGTNTALVTLASQSLVTSFIDEFVVNIQKYKAIFKNSETLLVTTALARESVTALPKTVEDRNTNYAVKTSQIDNTTIDVYQETKSFLPTKSHTPDICSLDDLVLKENLNSKNKTDAFSRQITTSPMRFENAKPSLVKNFEPDLRKSHLLLNPEKKSKVKFPGQISSLIGYLWVDIDFPIQSSFSKSKNKEYDYAFYNDFVWYKYNRKFDDSYQTNFSRESKRFMEDISILRKESRLSKLGFDKFSDDVIIERFRINQFYSRFNSKSENTLDDISKELYDYYNYKLVQNLGKINTPNGKIISNDNSEMNNFSDIPVDENLIDINSKEHKEIYEKVQEEILQKNLEDFVKKENCDTSFNKELKRRKSFTDTVSQNEKNAHPLLMRSDSFSEIEEYILYLNPEVQFNKMAHIIKRDDKIFKDFKVCSLNEGDNKVVLNMKKLAEIEIPLFEKNYEIIKSSLFQQLETNNTQIEKQKKQFDSTVSKYSYDTRLLQRKFKNTIETQEAFETKISALKKKFILESKFKGMQYLLQLFKDDLITLDDIKDAYGNQIISNELDKLALKLKDKADPKSIVDILLSTRLRIFYKGVHEGIVVSIFKMFISLLHFIIYRIKKLKIDYKNKTSNDNLEAVNKNISIE